MSPGPDRDTARRWFLGQGLPLVLGPRVRARHLLARSAPFLAGMYVVGFVGSVLLIVTDVPDAELDSRLAQGHWLVGYGLLLLALVALPGLAAFVVRRAVRSRYARPVVAGVLVLGLVGLPAVAAGLDGARPASFWLVDLLIALVATVAVLGLNYLGFGSIGWWATRFAWRQLGALGNLAGRALPLLMVTVVIFFTGELWQWAHTVDRAVVWRTVAFLALVAVLFMVTALRDELRQLRRQLIDDGDRERFAGLVRTTPFAGAPVPAEPLPLRPRERANIIGVLLVAQGIQVALFTVVVFAFFIGLGTVMLPDAVMSTWSGGDITPGRWFTVPLPIPNELVQMAMVVAVLSGLYFAVHSTIDPQYRARFFDPLLDDVAGSLAAREVYLAAWPGER